ncbi:hypothetical protein CTA2_2076 [Colletotrichum tanaceti]|uniref:Aminoglycoside phosphotransferase domain-containing protein n=1 Tax=Colletotrichum tanaceti TaxID=1306861 RepID=A0A4V6DGC5_9PEZI|nr:hypothetical protein CTA2_2076 [Colletotrichum tanaceti]TKW51976.1 hypothetical protein CTA1_11020 [Colletotrichum tanaceti]
MPSETPLSTSIQSLKSTLSPELPTLITLATFGLPISAREMASTCFDEGNVLAAVTQLGLGGLALSLDEQFRGGQCHIYKLSFLDEADSEARKSLAVRVPLYMPDGDGMISALRTEWQTLLKLQEKGFVWSPEPLGCSLTFDNPVKHPFLVLRWIEGSHACWNDTFPARPLRDKFLMQLAGIQTCLIECTLRVGPATWQEFFERIIENKRSRVLDGKLPGLSEQDCDDQKALLSHVLSINSQEGPDKKSFAIDHGDLKPENIIVDQDYNIKCIIDWGFADSVPLPRAAGLPRFLWGSSLSPTAQKDKHSYLAAVSSQHSPQGSLQLFQTEGNVEFRTLYLESLFSKGMHMLLAKNRWQIPGHSHIGDHDPGEFGN